MFVVVFEMAVASSWYGRDQDRHFTGRDEEQCGLYWAAIGPVCLGGHDAASALVVSWLQLTASLGQ
jgi:hypothetical protein